MLLSLIHICMEESAEFEQQQHNQAAAKKRIPVIEALLRHPGAFLKIIRAGMYTTVQDGGRHGFRQSGISHCGALDMPALRIANLLVGCLLYTSHRLQANQYLLP